MCKGKRVENKAIYNEVNNIKTDVAVLNEKVSNIEGSLEKIKDNELKHMAADIKTLVNNQTDLRINQAVLITKVTAIASLIASVVGFVIRLIFGV